jgi:hypothetical protein
MKCGKIMICGCEKRERREVKCKTLSDERRVRRALLKAQRTISIIKRIRLNNRVVPLV